MSKIRNRYSKSIEGLNAQGFFSPTGANTVSAAAAETLDVFLNTAVEGKVGIFNATTNVAVAIAGALAAGTKYYIAQKVDGLLKRSVTFDGGDVEFSATAFDAPVIQETRVGWNGVSGDLNIDIAGGLQEFVLRVNEITPASQPYPTIEGRAVVRNSVGVVDYDVANKIVNDANDVFDYESNADDKAIVLEVLSEAPSAAFPTTGTTTNQVVYPGQRKILLINVTVPVVGNYVSFAAGLAAPMYKIVSIDGLYITLDRPVTTQIGSGISVRKRDYDPADPAKDNIGIQILATAEDVVFSVGVSEDLSAADISQTIEWKQGSGAPWQVASMEKESQVFDGDTVQNAAFADEFGQPTSFVDAAADPATGTNQYDLLFIKYKKSTNSMAYANEYHTSFGYVVLGTIGVATVLGQTF